MQMPEMQTQPSPVDSMREATFTVSPKRQYLGIACPTTPVYKHKILDRRTWRRQCQSSL